MFDNLETLLFDVKGLQQDPTWTNNLCVSFISGLLNRVVDENATELKKLKDHKYCRLRFDATAAALTGSILAKHMEKLEAGDRL